MTIDVILLLIAGLFLPLCNDRTIQVTLQGEKGERGINGTTNIITKTIMVNGTNGKDGKDGIGRSGANGLNGKDAPVNTPAVVTITNMTSTHCYPKAMITFNVTDVDNDIVYTVVKYNTDNSSKWTIGAEYFSIGNYTTTVQFYAHNTTVYWTIIAMDGSDLTITTGQQVI